MAFALPLPLFSGVLDAVHFNLPDGIVNWLTPVWILGLGALVGLILCLAFWGLGNLLSRIPVVGNLADERTSRWIAVGVVTALFLAVALAIVLPGQLERSIEDIAGTVVVTAILSALGAMGTVAIVSRKTNAEVPLAVREGVLLPLFVIVCSVATFGVLGVTMVRKPQQLLESLVNYPALLARGTYTRTYNIDAPPGEFADPKQQAIPVSFKKAELWQMVFRSDQRLKVRTETFIDSSFAAQTIDVPAGGVGEWNKALDGTSPFTEDVITELFVKNYSSQPATLEVTFKNQLAYPEMLSVVQVGLAIFAVFVLYLIQRTYAPRLAAVALSTTKSEIAQPFFVIVTALGIFGLIVFVLVPYYTFGEDIKMLKGTSLNLILVAAILQAIWAASTSVAEEIDGKTALTVLSKPVSRRDFILGKFVGIAWTIGLMFAIFGVVLLVTVAFKPIYDGRENSADPDQVTWQVCHSEMMHTVPGLLLAYMETLVLAALSVAISTRLPMLANFIISFSIYVLGHLTPLMVQSQAVADYVPAPVVFLARMAATVLPGLDYFNTEASFATGLTVPTVYLLWSLVYSVLYSSVAMLLALTLFEDRDLA